jgi:hypothetical protein
MATSEHTAGLVPAVNDLLAATVILGVYIVRFGTVDEGVAPGLPLRVTTDLLLPLLGGVWLLAVPTVQVVQRLR